MFGVDGVAYSVAGRPLIIRDLSGETIPRTRPTPKTLPIGVPSPIERPRPASEACAFLTQPSASSIYLSTVHDTRRERNQCYL